MSAGLVSRTKQEASIRLGSDARLIVCGAIFGLGLGGLMHRALVAVFGRWDRLAVVPGADGAASRNDLLSFGPWIAIALSLGILALTYRGGETAWSWRRALGVAVAVAGVVVLVVGELEVHVFDTLAQGWKPHDLYWDVLFHVPGEAVALAGWLLLPTGTPARRGPG